MHGHGEGMTLAERRDLIAALERQAIADQERRDRAYLARALRARMVCHPCVITVTQLPSDPR